MKQIAESLLPLIGRSDAVLKEKMMLESGTVKVYADSVHTCGKAVVWWNLLL